MTAKKPLTKKSAAAVQLIKAYKFVPPSCGDSHEQFDAKAGTFKPFSALPADILEALDPYEYLDAITLAVEAGAVPQTGWVKHLFGTEEAFLHFTEIYSGYDEEYRTNDRWYRALQSLVDTGDEIAFVTSEEIANQLIEYAQETGQLSAD